MKLLDNNKNKKYKSRLTLTRYDKTSSISMDTSNY